MKIYELTDKNGRMFAFEVPSGFLGRRGACKVARSIPGVRILRSPRFLSWFREEEFCEFELDGQHFKMWEPFGDNNRYWIGPEPVHGCPQIDAVRRAFANRQFEVGASLMWAIVLMPVIYVSACSYRSHSVNTAFDSIRAGDTQAVVGSAMGQPLARETKGGARGVPFSNGCKDRCAEIW
jgi:hypothetical protein